MYIHIYTVHNFHEYKYNLHIENGMCSEWEGDNVITFHIFHKS